LHSRAGQGYYVSLSFHLIFFLPFNFFSFFRALGSDGRHRYNYSSDVVKFLIDAACRKVVPDAPARSLFLVVEASGHKGDRSGLRQPDGRRGMATLGPFDRSGRKLTGDPQIERPLTLLAARQLAARVHRDRALGGHDVVADHRARRLVPWPVPPRKGKRK
jgi:hypothetical protein